MRRIFVVLFLMFITIWTMDYGLRTKNSLFAAGDDYIVAEIGKYKVYFSEIKQVAQGLNRFLKENFQMSKDWRLNYIRQYIARLALARRAEREGLKSDEDVIFVLEQAKRNILSDKILSNEIAKIKIGEEDYKKYYEQNKAKYQIKEKIKLSYIKVSSKKKADSIIAQLNKGKSFKRAAGRKIVKAEDWISRDGMFVPGLEDITPEALNGLFTLGIGGTSESVEVTSKDTQYEYYIFHIDEKEPAKDRPFDEVRRQVGFELSKKLRDEAVNKFINETFAQEKVTIYEDRVVEEMKKAK